MIPDTYNFPAMRRGDTFRGRNIATLTQDGVALGLTSARLQVRLRGSGTVLHEWSTTGASPNATITGASSNTVTLAAVAPAATELWVPGDHEYDLEVVFASDSATLTIFAGKFPVKADITRTV
jgi:hypothetical protein